MGRQNKQKTKHRNFLALLRPLLDSEEWLDLSNSAKLTYVYIKKGYNGSNNGEIVVPYSQLQKILNSTATISKVLNELENKRWIDRSLERGLYHKATKYTLTFKYDHFH